MVFEVEDCFGRPTVSVEVSVASGAIASDPEFGADSVAEGTVGEVIGGISSKPRADADADESVEEVVGLPIGRFVEGVVPEVRGGTLGSGSVGLGLASGGVGSELNGERPEGLGTGGIAESSVGFESRGGAESSPGIPSRSAFAPVDWNGSRG